jgi:hypothetical protein
MASYRSLGIENRPNIETASIAIRDKLQNDSNTIRGSARKRIFAPWVLLSVHLRSSDINPALEPPYEASNSAQ